MYNRPPASPKKSGVSISCAMDKDATTSGANDNLLPEPEVTKPERMTLIDDLNQSVNSDSKDETNENNLPPAKLPS